MGNIKTSFVKRVGKKLFDEHSGNFSGNFEENKEKVKELATIKSKKLRNVIIGYITNLKKQEIAEQ